MKKTGIPAISNRVSKALSKFKSPSKAKKGVDLLSIVKKLSSKKKAKVASRY